MSRRHNIFLGIAGCALFGAGISVGRFYSRVYEHPKEHVERAHGLQSGEHPDSAQQTPLSQPAAGDLIINSGPTVKELLSHLHIGTVDPSGKVSTHAASLFKLSETEVAAIENETGVKVQQIKELERANATIEAQNDTGARILIKGFKNQGETLKDQYKSSLKRILGQRADNWILASSSSWRAVFSNFGDFASKNLIMQFNPDGTQSIEIAIKPTEGGPTYGEKLTVQEIPDRLSHLLQLKSEPSGKGGA